MEVILTEDVPNLGEMGDVVQVSPGYGRNYLIPQRLALPATASKKKELEHQKRQIELKKEQQREAARGVQAQLDGVAISIPKRVSEGDKLYGSVSAREIADVLNKEGFEVQHRNIEVGEGLSELGIYNVSVKLASGVFAAVKVWVVAM